MSSGDSELVQQVKQTSLFSLLETPSLLALTRACNEASLKKGDTMPAALFTLVLEGSVAIGVQVVDTARKAEELSAKAGSGRTQSTRRRRSSGTVDRSNAIGSRRGSMQLQLKILFPGQYMTCAHKYQRRKKSPRKTKRSQTKRRFSTRTSGSTGSPSTRTSTIAKATGSTLTKAFQRGKSGTGMGRASTGSMESPRGGGGAPQITEGASSAGAGLTLERSASMGTSPKASPTEEASKREGGKEGSRTGSWRSLSRREEDLKAEDTDSASNCGSIDSFNQSGEFSSAPSLGSEGSGVFSQSFLEDDAGQDGDGKQEEKDTLHAITTLTVMSDTCRVLYLSSTAGLKIATKRPSIAPLINVINNEDPAELLRRIPFLKAAAVEDGEMGEKKRAAEARMLLASLVSYECVRPGASIMEEGDTEADTFYVIVSGHVSVMTRPVRKGEDGSGTGSGIHRQADSAGLSSNGISSTKSIDRARFSSGRSTASTSSRSLALASTKSIDSVDDDLIEVAQLGPGAYFGEMALVANMPRTATIRAKEECVFLCLKRSSLERVSTNMPELRQGLDLYAKQRMLGKFHATRMPLFIGLDNSAMMGLAQICSIQEYSEGDALWEEDDPLLSDLAFCIVIHGSVEITRKTDSTPEGEEEAPPKVMAHLGPGDYVGEVALIQKVANRRETARCLERSVLLSMKQTDFEEFFPLYPRLYTEFQLKILQPAEITLKHILQHPEAQMSFTDFMTKERATESLAFYMAAEEYAHLAKVQTDRTQSLLEKNGGLLPEAESDEANMKELAISTYQRFVKPGAEEEVNISGTCRKEIEAGLQQETVSPTLLVKAQTEVFKVMSMDNFRRYRESTFFQELEVRQRIYGSQTGLLDDLDALRSGKSKSLGAVAGTAKAVRGAVSKLKETVVRRPSFFNKPRQKESMKLELDDD